MSPPRALLRCLLTIAFALVTARASATPNFPGALSSKVGGPAPDCSICHVCRVTMVGTVNTPWGSAMRARGLVKYDENTLRAAVDKMIADQVDSDGDGTIDVDALKAGKDPNPPTCDGADDPFVPSYGCFGRIAPVPSSGPGAGLALVVALAVAIARRRRRGAGSASLVAVVLLSATTAGGCKANGAGLAARENTLTAARPQMTPVTPSAFAGELRELGLDPMNLPRFEDLTTRQRRRLMGTFTRSLGVACNDCHDRNDYLVSTRAKYVTVQMWNQLTRPFQLEGGGPVYCDSCHHADSRFLDRHDKKAVATFMARELVGKLEAHDKQRVECESCHGTPFRPLFLPR